jgi:hypothetical protein
MQDQEDEETDDEDYVPESLRGFLEEADKQLQAHKDDVLNFDSPSKNRATSTSTSNSNSSASQSQVPHKPKAVPNPECFNGQLEEHDEIDDDDEMFVQILQKEGDQQLAQDLLQGIQHDRSQSSGSGMFSPLQDPLHHADFLSPAMSDITDYENNPAAHLTESQAKSMAMEGDTPQQTTSRKAKATATSATKQRTRPQQPRNLKADMDGNVDANVTTTTTTTPTTSQSKSNRINPKDQEQKLEAWKRERLARSDPTKDPIMESIVKIPTLTPTSTSKSASRLFSSGTKRGNKVAPSPPSQASSRESPQAAVPPPRRASPPISQPPTPLQSPETKPNTPRRTMANTNTSSNTTIPAPPSQDTTIPAPPSQDVSPQKQMASDGSSLAPNAHHQWPVQAQRPKSPPPPLHPTPPKEQNNLPSPPSMLSNDGQTQVHVDQRGGMVLSKRRPIPAAKGLDNEHEESIPTPKPGRELHPKAMAADVVVPAKIPQLSSGQQQEQKKSKQQQQQQPPMSIATQSPASRSAQQQQQQRSQESKSSPLAKAQTAGPVGRQSASAQQQRSNESKSSPLAKAQTALPVGRQPASAQQQRSNESKSSPLAKAQTVRLVGRQSASAQQQRSHESKSSPLAQAQAQAQAQTVRLVCRQSASAQQQRSHESKSSPLAQAQAQTVRLVGRQSASAQQQRSHESKSSPLPQAQAAGPTGLQVQQVAPRQSASAEQQELSRKSKSSPLAKAHAAGPVGLQVQEEAPRQSASAQPQERSRKTKSPPLALAQAARPVGLQVQQEVPRQSASAQQQERSRKSKSPPLALAKAAGPVGLQIQQVAPPPQPSASAQQQERSRKSKSPPLAKAQARPPQQRPRGHPLPTEVLVKSPLSNADTTPASNSTFVSQQQRKTKVIPSYMRVTTTAARRMDRMRPAKLDIPGSSGVGSTAIPIRQARSKPTPESLPVVRRHTRSSTTTGSSQYSSSVSGYSETTGPTLGDATLFSDPYGGKRIAKAKVSSSRFLQGTAASKARLERPRQTSSVASSPREYNKSSPISSRLLQGTAASQTRESYSSSKDDSDQQAATRVQAWAELETEKKLERERQSQEGIERRQQQKKERNEKIQQSLQRGRERREKVLRQERDRIANLEAKLLEKENKHPTPSTRDGRPMGAKVSGPRPKYIRPRTATPTIPISPVFATDSRVNRKDRPKRDEHVSLASSDEMHMNYLRRDEATPVRTSGERPGLTIPQGPKLATAARHGDKTPAAPIPEVDDADVRRWQGGLRSVSSPSAAERPHKLTIPHTPKFQEIKKRELPKSTREKEMEVIEYYKSHPFKANPVKMQDLGTPPVPRKKLDRRLTTPEPYHLHASDRVAQIQHQEDKIEQFRARPMPDFSATKKIPLMGKTPNTEKKKLTYPQPFHFRTVDRASSSEQSHSEPEGDNVQFRARPVPNFIKHSGLVIHRDPDSVRKSYVEATPETFKARPMPNFSTRIPISPPARKAGKPLTTPTPFQFHTEERASHTPTSSTTHGSQPERFKARAMPTFAKAAIAVRDRDPERTPSPPKHSKRMRQEEPQPKPFRAKPIPKTHLEPSIPVRERISPTKKVTQEPQSPPKPFRAKKLRKGSTKPTIPVKDRNPIKLRSPDAVMRPKERDEEELDYVFKAKPVPDFSQPKQDPPIRNTVIQDPQGTSPPKASARVAKNSLRARMAERQSGSTASSTRRESLNKFLSYKDEQRIRDTNNAVAIAGDVGMLCGVPALISMPDECAGDLVEGATAVLSAFTDPRESFRGIAAKKQTVRVQNEFRHRQEKERAEQAKKREPDTHPPRQEEETESKRQLRAATDAWMQESQPGTARRHATGPPATYTMTEEERAREEASLMSEERAREEALLMSEERAREEALLMSEEMEAEAASQAEASERSRHEGFLQQAYEVERAAEDEISYHGSSRHERTIGVDPSDVDAFWNYNGSRR